MPKIKYDSNYMNNEIKSEVKDSMRKLQKISSEASSLNIPSDFKYRQSLIDLQDKINNKIRKLNKYVTWINDCNRIYSTVVNEHEKTVESVETIAIKKRDKLI